MSAQKSQQNANRSSRRSRRSRQRGNDQQPTRSSGRDGNSSRKPRQGGGSSRKRRRKRPQGDSRRGDHSAQRDNRAFWGDTTGLPESRPDIRITDAPAAVPRSLGPPPLPGHESIAEHYFTAVYGRAVTTAGALAAAGGLIDPESLTETDG